MRNLLEMPIWQMTGAEFLELQKTAIGDIHPVEVISGEPNLIYGLRGLRNLLGISHATASKLTNSAELKGTFSRIGKKLVFDRDAVLKALGRA